MDPGNDAPPPRPRVESLSALTLATRDMQRSVRFYQSLGFTVRFGGEDADFSTLIAGTSCLNLISQPEQSPPGWWGRAIFYVSDVDAMHAHAVRMGLTPQMPPRDAEWGERYFHLTDPDGHELSFAKPLSK